MVISVIRHKLRVLEATELLAMLLGGCGSTMQLDKSDKFDESAKDAVLIVGLVKEPESYFMHGIIWRPVDPLSNALKYDDETTFKTELPGSNLPSVRKDHIVHRVPAGTYAIDRMEGHYEAFGTSFLQYHIRFRPNAYVVRLEPGEVVYIGDFEISAWTERIVGGVQHNFRHAGADISAVEKKLATYPNLKGKVLYREPEFVKLQLPTSR